LRFNSILTELDRIIDGDRYFLSPRIQALREIGAMLNPYPARRPRRRRGSTRCRPVVDIAGGDEVSGSWPYP